MKTMKFLFGMLLAAVCSIQTMAQTIEDGEAFYIYRNDGDFDGFFYDDVQEMRFSKIGVDSLEYDDFVVQEVVTADSIYRIPLCAIDSIGFVQPEIEFNPRLKIMEDLGMLQYMLPRYWYMPDLIRFDPKMPRDLVPKVGDVLVSFDEETFPEKKGIGGKVVSVDIYDDEINVSIETLTSLHDIFTRFITIEHLTAAPDGSQKVRMAGYRQMQEAMAPKKKAISYDSDIFKFDGTLTHEFKYGDHKSISASLDVGIRVGVSVCYDIDIDHIFMKTSMRENLSLQTGFTAQFSGDWEPPLAEKLQKALAIRFPAQFPIFETHPIPNVFFRANGTLALKTTLPKISYNAKQLVIFSDRTGSMLNCRFNDNVQFLEPNQDFFEASGASLSLSGFMQAGIKFAADIATNSWVKDFFHGDIGLTTYVGPKISGSLECDLAQLAKGNFYESISNSALNFSLCNIDMEASASIFCKGVGSDKEKFGEASYAFGESQYFLVPKLETFDVTQDENDRTRVGIDINWANKLLYLGSTSAGYVIKRFDEESQKWVEEDRFDSYIPRDPEYRKHLILDITWLKAGEHIITPFVKLPILNDTIYISEREKSFYIEPILKFKQERYTIPTGKVGGENIKLDIPFTTNAMTINVQGDFVSREVEWTPGEGGVIHLTIEPNSHWTYAERELSVSSGRTITNVGNTTIIAPVEKTIIVEQAPNLDFSRVEYDLRVDGTYTNTRSNWCHCTGTETESYTDTYIRLQGLVPCTLSLNGDILAININGEYGGGNVSGTINVNARTGLLNHSNINFVNNTTSSIGGHSDDNYSYTSTYNESWSVGMEHGEPLLDYEIKNGWAHFYINSFSYGVKDTGSGWYSHYTSGPVQTMHKCSHSHENTQTFSRSNSEDGDSFQFRLTNNAW